MTSFPTLLGIDYGTQRIGIAISHTSLAEPLTIILSDRSAIPSLQEIVKKYSIEKIILGLSENEMAEKTKAFAEELKKNVIVPIEFVDETLTSAEVHSKFAEKEKGKRKYKGPIDHYAAAEILQMYLNDLS